MLRLLRQQLLRLLSEVCLRRSIEHCITKDIAMDKYCIEYVIYAVKRAALTYQERCYHCVERIVSDLAAGTEKFDRHVKFFCVLHILWCDLGDSFGINILVIQEFTVCQRRKDRDLTACIISLYIAVGLPRRIPLPELP